MCVCASIVAASMPTCGGGLAEFNSKKKERERRTDSWANELHMTTDMLVLKQARKEEEEPIMPL